jgi:hypothetical protein
MSAVGTQRTNSMVAVTSATDPDQTLQPDVANDKSPVGAGSLAPWHAPRGTGNYSIVEGAGGLDFRQEGDGLMNAPKRAVKAARSLRQLNKLVETERWVHHVADLNSGEVLVPAGPPVTPLSRGPAVTPTVALVLVV